MSKFVRVFALQNFCIFVTLFATSCSSGQSPSVFGEVTNFQTREEVPISANVVDFLPVGSRGPFVVIETRNGKIQLDSGTGDFFFEPDIDFYGEAGFDFIYITDGFRLTKSKVLIDVDNVNDPPQIAFIPDQTNSRSSELTDLTISIFDPDPEAPKVAVTVTDPTIAVASYDSESRRLSIRALKRGSTSIRLTASDAESTDNLSFTFTAKEYSNEYSLSFTNLETGAVSIYNESDLNIDFLLTHNGFSAFEDVADIVNHVESLPPLFVDEPFERKLWRFIRDNVYHDVPLGEARWLNDPWVTINSLGWGFCGNVSGAFVSIAKAAGYDARVWGLNGHVVPEILVDGNWRMYDPDLSIYYKMDDGNIAGVEDLVDNPLLITNPVDPIFSGVDYEFPYSSQVAEIYSTAENNYIANDVFLSTNQSPPGRIVLPPRARFDYPGRWTESVTGFDGPAQYSVRHFHQALLSLDEGWTGVVALPFILWDVIGNGQIGVDGDIFSIGTSDLLSRIRDSHAPITQLDVYSGSSIQLVFLINAVRFNIRENVEISLTSFGNWGLEVTESYLAPEIASGGPIDQLLRKPKPVLVP